MDQRLVKIAYPLALLAFAGLFAFEALSAAVWAGRLSRADEAQEALSSSLTGQAAQITSLVKQAKSSADELTFLQTLPALLPKDKGYLRTQRAISSDVRALRRKLAPKLKNSLYIVVDAKANKLYLKKGFKLLMSADVSVGRGGRLYDRKTGQRWKFVTPRGEFHVLSKAENPLWRKPDWAFVEEGKPIPPPDDPSRLIPGELGAYLLNLGDGYLIHGTKDEKVLGRPASHGCVRLGADDLKKLYATVPVGTRVFIFY